MKKLALLVFVLFLIVPAQAQIVLTPGTTEIFVTSIVLEPVDPSYEYTRTRQYVALQGDMERLRLTFSVRYFDYEQRDIGANCWLNCPYTVNISVNCTGYQVCSFIGLPGIRVCEFVAPNYNLTQENSVICRFYDPQAPSVEYLPYPNRTFYVYNYGLNISSYVRSKVGQPIDYYARVINLGLIQDSYTTNLSLLTGGVRKADVSPAIRVSDTVSYGTPALNLHRIIPLADGEIYLGLYTKSNNLPYTCYSDSDCSFLGNALCIQNACWKFNQITVSTTALSLPEYGLQEYLALVFLSFLAFVFAKKKFNKLS